MSVTRKGLDRSIFGRYETLEIKAGILAGATYPADELTDARTGEKVPDSRAGMKVATIAAALNYGFGKVPPRPFMNVTVAREKTQWAKAVTTLMVQTRDSHRTLLTVGQIMKEDIQTTISQWPADNSPDWAAFKGFNHGLVLTSHLLKSVESELVE